MCSLAWARRTPLELAPGIEDCLAALDEASVSVGIVFDVGMAPSPTLRLRLERFGVLDRFKGWAFSDETGWFKPAPEAFAPSLEALGVTDPTRAEVAGAGHVGAATVAHVGGAGRVGDTERLECGGEGLGGGLEPAGLVAEGPTLETVEHPEPLEPEAQRRGRRHADVADDPDAHARLIQRREALLDAGGELERRPSRPRE